MDERFADLDRVVSASVLLGYLNFSDGKPDPRWRKQFNDAYAHLVDHHVDRPWSALLDWLDAGLAQLHASGSAAFRDVGQATAVQAGLRETLAAYRRHHADLLGHQDERALFAPFFLAVAYETVLVQRKAYPDDPVSAPAVLARLNDFVGHRPLAILETRPQGEPYEHERHRPVPLFLRGAGVACGPYQEVIRQAVDILAAADSDLLAEAQLHLNLLDEMALDLRAYDHGHPVNRRSNYVFGEWDPHHLDNQGRYRRYVIRQTTLDVLMERVNQAEGPRDERVYEAAAVLAGTLLMASGVSGYGPGAHDSSVTLANLLPRVARYRDAFYAKLLERLNGPHGQRLRQEQARMHQPFGGVRQHLNGALARQRAAQMQQRYLVLLLAEMGYAEASRVEAQRIPAVSVRLLGEMHGALASGRVDAEQGKLSEAAERLPLVENLLRRGIACGALADPWNILGFQGLFPLSPAREDSVRDPRIDELLQVMEGIFDLHSRLIGEAAAAGRPELVRTLRDGMGRLATWWDRFATVGVGDLRRVQGGEAAAAAARVATALERWQQRGGAVADLAFWRGHLDGFQSPRAYAMVLDTLLRQADYRAALALLCSWLSRWDEVSLEDGGVSHGTSFRGPLPDGAASFHTLALRWMLALTRPLAEVPVGAAPLSDGERRNLVTKFFDHLEANADDLWQVPALDVERDVDDEEETEDDSELFDAAYEGVTFRESGNRREGGLDDGGPVEMFDLEVEAERLERRLRFLSTVARLWRVATRFLSGEPMSAAESEAVRGWRNTARTNQGRLLTLLDAVHAHPVPEPSGDYDSLIEYDRHRLLKEQLLYTAIGTSLDTTLAVNALNGLAERTSAPPVDGTEPLLPMPTPADEPWESRAVVLEQALFAGEVARAKATLSPFLERFRAEPLLFTPLTEGGPPRPILRVRIAQSSLGELLSNLPRLGLLRETYDVLRTARAMEQSVPLAGRGVTEFNHFFQAAYQAVLESVLASAASWEGEAGADEALVQLLERVTAPFLTLWIDHSRSLQLSVLESVQADPEWQALRGFIRTYGSDLFQSRFLKLQNLRGVLHRGVSAYLDYLRDNPDPLHPVRLVDDVDVRIRREEAVRRLETALQAVVENFEEYNDYNTTTTQSDYGENLHVLLDFLRLKASYERNAWQFRPLVLAHEVLARRGRTSAAVLWEESLTKYTSDLAQQHLDQLTHLEQTHGVRLNTVSDRLNERFVKPLALDRLCALIEPSMHEVRQGSEQPSFARLQAELRAYTATPTGVGLDVPFWLRRLEMEVRRVEATHTTIAALAENFFRVPRRLLSLEEIQRQLGEWERPALPG